MKDLIVAARALLGRIDGRDRLTRAELEAKVGEVLDRMDAEPVLDEPVLDEPVLDEPVLESRAELARDAEKAPDAEALPEAPPEHWSLGSCAKCRREGMLIGKPGVCPPGNGCAA